MHRRLLAVTAALLMAMPGTALAADPTPAEAPGSGPTIIGHYYYLAAIELGGETRKLEGKLWIEGEQLGASVGCNSIGARVAFDGAVLEILDGIVTTEMGCPAELAEAESLLVRALSSGPLRWDGSGFSGSGIRIVVTEVATGPVSPPDVVVVPPDTPITSEPDPLPIIDPETCREFLTEDEWSAIFGDPGAVSGSGGGTAGGVTPDGGEGSDSSDGSPGTDGGETDPGVATPGTEPQPPAPDPAPGEVVEPGPVDEPDPSGTVDEPAPPPIDPAPVPPTEIVTEPTPVIPDPAVGTTTVNRDDVPVAEPKSGPAPTPSAELCRELLARISAVGAPQAPSGPGPGPEPDKGGNGEAEMARDMSAAEQVRPEVAFTLVLLGGLLLIAWLRTMGARPRRT